MRILKSKPLVLLVSFIFIEASRATCLDKFALSSVDALVRKQKNAKAFMFREENFNKLDNYISIDVLRGNVSELCEGMIKNFPILESLTLINLNITSIESGTFQNVHRLEYVSLAVNRLTHIPRGVFDHLKGLKVLYLSNNQIETIEDAAFAEIPSLKAVHLDHNNILKLTGKILFGCPKLSFVDFSFNQLTTIEDKSFDDLQYSKTSKPLKIFLQRNQLESVSKYALAKLKFPVNLHLEFNNLKSVSDVVSPLSERSAVHLVNNQIECISDDVLKFIKVTQIYVDVDRNPVQCQCVARGEEILGEDSKGELSGTTTLPCFPGSSIFGNQL